MQERRARLRVLVLPPFNCVSCASQNVENGVLARPLSSQQQDIVPATKVWVDGAILKLASAFLAELTPEAHPGSCYWHDVARTYDSGSALFTFGSNDRKRALCLRVTSPGSFSPEAALYPGLCSFSKSVEPAMVKRGEYLIPG